MLYLIYGTDTHKGRKKLHELLELAKKKRPDAELFKMTSENWSESQFDELLVSQGLFEQKYTVVLDNLFEKKDYKNYIVERLEGMQSSEQIFLMLEGSVDAPTLKKIEKFSKQVQEFVKKEEKKEWFNIFGIADGILQKDKRLLWVSYLDFLKKGTASEEIHGIFFWQIKNMILASRAGNSNETGLSPFVYKNALTGARKYKIEELQTMSSELVEMTHKVRSGEGELEVMLEKWILHL
jgi:DNA polymerase III delta subunit